MTAALEWIKARTATRNEAPIEADGVVYSITVHYFCGRLSDRMIREISKVKMVKTDTCHETFIANLRSGMAEYLRTEYTPA